MQNDRLNSTKSYIYSDKYKIQSIKNLIKYKILLCLRNLRKT